MAVQIPDPGQGDNKTGDNEYVFRKKVRDNFADQSNAASYTVGYDSANKIPLSKDIMQALSTGIPNTYSTGGIASIDDVPKGSSVVAGSDNWLPYTGAWIIHRIDTGIPSHVIAIHRATGERHWQQKNHAGEWSGWSKAYTDKNTVLASDGTLKPSSPVLRVFSDRIEGNADGDTMAATYTKNGVGDYTITGTTGLRSDGWYITIPNDINGNPKVAVTLDDADGVITLKTYARIFDMTTFKFVPDLNQPLDIPDARWIDLRFNDFPAEPMPPEV